MMYSVEVLVVFVVLALVAGVVLGQWIGEVRRARTDMRKVWRSRKDYRRPAPPKKK